MSRIIIKNIGPITEVDLTLNKVNVIMGPQSSGKSTIAKIISFCQWAEKRYVLDDKFEYDVRSTFINFHRLSEVYFTKESYIEYESDFVKIIQTGTRYKLKISAKKNHFNYKLSKNIYVPAERNFVSVIPNLGKYNESNDNIMSFMYDWHDAKKSFTSQNHLRLLNLGITYHYVQEGESDVLSIGKNKELMLQDASSGLQSVTPLLMLINYLTDSFYKENKPQSIDERDAARNFLDKLAVAFSDPKIKTIKANIEGKPGKTMDIPRWLAHNLSKSLPNNKEYFFTNFIIEEPEQNLFPTTQRDLVYYLFDKIANTERPHNLLITTHSPFVLYAINNCIMGKRVSDDMPEDEREELQSHQSWIDAGKVSIWQMHEGTIKSVLDERTGTVTKHYFNEIMNELMDEYYEMLSYFKDDQ